MAERVRRLAIVAGAPSHPPGLHEFRAGALLLAACLEGVEGLATTVHVNGEIPDIASDDIDAIVIYSDGGPTHPLLQGKNLQSVDDLARAGVGIGLMHYAVEISAGVGGESMTRWIGGHYVDGESCNPIWEARFDSLPDHPVSRGVEPFSTVDEWYFNIRFASGAASNAVRVAPILVATPSADVRSGPYVWPKGPYDHIVAAAGRSETLMWVAERDDGGRGLGLNGGHVHTNWANEDFRRVVLNGLVWLTGMDLPEGGVFSTLSDADLQTNLDPKTQSQ